MDVAPVFAAMLDDMQASVPTPVIAARFHSAFVEAIVNVADWCEPPTASRLWRLLVVCS